MVSEWKSLPASAFNSDPAEARCRPLKNLDDFAFDNQVLAQVHWLGAAIGEVTCPAKYMREASSINFQRSVRYGLAALAPGCVTGCHGGGWLRLRSEERESFVRKLVSAISVE